MTLVTVPGHDLDAALADERRDAGSAVTAEGPTSRLELRWEQAWNLHYGGRRGAEHENSLGAVTLALVDGGRSRAVDQGKREESVLDGSDYTERSTHWRTAWQGTWALDGRRLSLDLERASTSCTKTRSERDGARRYPLVKTTCRTGVDHLALECEPMTVDAAPRLWDFTSQPVATPVWRCRPRDAITVAIGTPFPWVFGKKRCLARTGGGRASGPVRYAYCER